jgi:hypothetical protein
VVEPVVVESLELLPWLGEPIPYLGYYWTQMLVEEVGHEVVVAEQLHEQLEDEELRFEHWQIDI